MNDLARQIMEIIKEYSHFPGPILQSQTKRMGKTAENIDYGDLPQLAEYVGKSIGSFSNPVKGEEAKEKILNIV